MEKNEGDTVELLCGIDLTQMKDPIKQLMWGMYKDDGQAAWITPEVNSLSTLLSLSCLINCVEAFREDDR